MTGDTIGGVFDYALTLSRTLARHGVAVTFATMGSPANPGQRQEASRVENLVLVESDFALEWMDSPFDDVERAGDWLLSIEDQCDPDVVHLNGYCHANLPFTSPALVVAHSSVPSWWRAVRRERTPPEYDEYHERVRAGLDAAAALVAPSHYMLRQIEMDYGPRPASAVIYNGVSEERFQPGPKEPFFLGSGRLWDRGEGTGCLARVADRLPWPVSIAGELTGPNGTAVEFEGPAKLLGTLTPAVLAELMGRATIYVHPALYEPFGLAPLEAGLSGCALVLGDIESLREIWDGAAVFVPPEDPDALVHACASLAVDEAALGSARKRCMARAREFSTLRMADAYLSLYDSLFRARREQRGGPPHPRAPPGTTRL